MTSNVVDLNEAAFDRLPLRQMKRMARPVLRSNQLNRALRRLVEKRPFSLHRSREAGSSLPALRASRYFAN